MSAECPPRRLLTGCPVLPNIPSQADSCARSFIHVNRKEAQKAEHNVKILFNRLKYTDTALRTGLIWDHQQDAPPEPNRKLPLHLLPSPTPPAQQQEVRGVYLRDRSLVLFASCAFNLLS